MSTKVREMSDEEKARLRMHLRTAFLMSESGRMAGLWLLSRLRYMDVCDDDEDRFLHNFACRFMAAGQFKVTDFLEGAQHDA